MIPELPIVAWTPIPDDEDKREECHIGPFRIVAAPPNRFRYGYWVVILNDKILASRHVQIESINETKALGLGQVHRYAFLLHKAVSQLLPER